MMPSPTTTLSAEQVAFFEQAMKAIQQDIAEKVAPFNNALGREGVTEIAPTDSVTWSENVGQALGMTQEQFMAAAGPDGQLTFAEYNVSRQQAAQPDIGHAEKY